MKKRWITVISVILAFALGAVFAIAANPGSQEDPLISKSYIEGTLKPEIYAYIDQKAQGGFEVVSVKAGKTVLGGAGTEMILRMGQACVIGSDRGGIADVTQGVDLTHNAAAPANHMLIVPMEDGRGLYISPTTDAILMIKGSYKIW
ncbi:MAG: hypothetical protein IJD83_00045 [Clostridia bacterium]|nr:hypothetical protein [Clostridia bacterium]